VAKAIRVKPWKVNRLPHEQDLKKVQSGRPGQGDISSGQVTFYSHLPVGKGSGKSFAD